MLSHTLTDKILKQKKTSLTSSPLPENLSWMSLNPNFLLHICKTLYCLCKVLNSFIRIHTLFHICFPRFLSIYFYYCPSIRTFFLQTQIHNDESDFWKSLLPEVLYRTAFLLSDAMQILRYPVTNILLPHQIL